MNGGTVCFEREKNKKEVKDGKCWAPPVLHLPCFVYTARPGQHYWAQRRNRIQMCATGANGVLTSLPLSHWELLLLGELGGQAVIHRSIFRLFLLSRVRFESTPTSTIPQRAIEQRFCNFAIPTPTHTHIKKKERKKKEQNRRHALAP